MGEKGRFWPISQHVPAQKILRSAHYSMVTLCLVVAFMYLPYCDHASIEFEVTFQQSIDFFPNAIEEESVKMKTKQQ